MPLVGERIVTTSSLSSHSTVTTWGVLPCILKHSLQKSDKLKSHCHIKLGSCKRMKTNRTKTAAKICRGASLYIFRCFQYLKLLLIILLTLSKLPLQQLFTAITNSVCFDQCMIQFVLQTSLQLVLFQLWVLCLHWNFVTVRHFALHYVCLILNYSVRYNLVLDAV